MGSLFGMIRAMGIVTTAIAVIFSIENTTTSATVMLSQSGESDKDRDETGLENSKFPLPSRNSKNNQHPLELLWGDHTGIFRKDGSSRRLLGDSSDDEDSNNYGEDREKIKATIRKFYRGADPNFARDSLASLKHGDSDDEESDDYREYHEKINSNRHPLELLWGDQNDIFRKDGDSRRLLGDSSDDEGANNYGEDREKIKATIRKFYRGADPKFARASLASLKQKQQKLHLLTPTDGTSPEQVAGDSDENNNDDNDDSLLPGTVLEFFMEDHSYELVERMQLELGATPQHYMDFAYRSVTASSSSSSTIGEDQATCKAVVPIVEEPGDSKARSSRGTTAAGDATDQALSFFASWWKWWMPYANSQWWKDNGSTNADYDMGETPFAGGSNGEVWRGRRICHQRPPHSDSSVKEGDSSGESREDSNENGGYPFAFFKPSWWKSRVGKGSKDPEDKNRHHDWAEPDSRHDGDCDDQTPLVLKRLRVERGYLLLEAGLREVYFGKLIARVLEDTKQDMYTVYVDHFFREVPRRQPRRAFGGRQNQPHRGNDLELWIVYKDAGPSLRSYIYSPIVSESGFVMHQHSKLWTKLRTFTGEEETNHDNESDIDDWDDSSVENPEPGASRTDKRNRDRKLGRLFLQKTLREVLAAAAELHKRGIVHRDIKPSNVMCQPKDEPVSFEALFESETFPNIVCKLGDFSSGWDRYTSEHLYTKGPTPGEQTDEYAPPESYVGPYWKPFDADKPQSYDSWSIGVLALELLLGTPNVFSVDQRTNALLTNKLQRARASEEEIAYALYLASLANFCIFVPSNGTAREDSWPLRYGDPLHKTAMVKESCTLQDFHRALRARDPLGIGFDSSTDLLLHLIWQLLAFDPSKRMTAEEALQHPYFISPDGTLDSLHQIPGCQNALVSEILDHRIDFDVEDEIKTFECPTCGRIFHDWQSCHQHANLRKHAKFCVYNHTVLPSCINTHSMLPEHPTSGYCDLQGRRKTIEDFHSIHLHHGHQFYGIFDGHTGNLASKFAASELYTELLAHLPDLMKIEGKKSSTSSIAGNGVVEAWKEEIRINVTSAFETVHERFLDRIKTMTSPISEVGSAPKMDQSGTTATALLVTQDAVIAAVLGDSRGVLASARSQDLSTTNIKSKRNRWNKFPEVSAIPFSIDHVASDPTERELVRQRGGFISTVGNTARVNGTLAITRSIGDAHLAPVLSREPHVRAFVRSELQELCGDLGSPAPQSQTNENQAAIPCFAILASDGLWDVMSNQEAVDMVVEIILRHNVAQASLQHGENTTREVALVPSSNDDDNEDNIGPFQESAERLAVEAYVRGSTDNIGVCVVAID